MSPTLPPWVEALQSAFAKSPELGFQWLKPEIVAKATELLLEGLDQAPYGDEFQEEGRARIRRSIALALGPTRTRRLTQIEIPSILLFDPEQPDRVWLSPGTQFPPQLWPSAEPTTAGIARDFAVYLSSSWGTRASLPCSVRIQRGSLEELGVESVDAFASLMARVEPWLDGQATWANACDDDPWPSDPTEHSMLSLRVVSDRARKTRGDRAHSVSMRTLWSRSIVTIEHAPFTVVVEFRYAPAPLVAKLPAGDGHLLVPEDLPADLLASLIRSGSTTPASLEKARRETGLTPDVVVTSAMLEPGESTTHALLGELRSNPDHRMDAAALAADLGARSFVYAAAAEETDPERKAKMLSWIALSPPAASAGEPPDDSQDDDDNDDDDDDWDDQDDDEEAIDEEEEES